MPDVQWEMAKLDIGEKELIVPGNIKVLKLKTKSSAYPKQKAELMLKDEQEELQGINYYVS